MPSKRITTPHPIGPLEGMYGGPADSAPGLRRNPNIAHEDVFVSYDGPVSQTSYGELHPAPTRPYSVQQEPAFPAPANWGVRSAEGHLAYVHLHGAANALGTQEHAEEWAARINARWGLA